MPTGLGTPVNDLDDTLSEAIPVGSMTSNRLVRRSAAIGFATDVDMYRFTVTAGSTVEITVQAREFTDPFLRLFDHQGKELAFNDDGPVPNSPPGLSSYLQFQFSAQGTYYVGVSGFPNFNYDPVRGTGDVEGSTGPYTLTIRLVQQGGGGVEGGGSGGSPTSQFDIVLRFGPGISPAQQRIFRQAEQRWEQIIIGDLPDVVYQGETVDDVVIDVSVVPIDGPFGTLGQAGPTALRLPSFLPIFGIMEFDTADVSRMQQDGQLRDLILHEMAHVLGFGTIWDLRGLLSGPGTSDPRFVGTEAVRQYQAIFNTTQTSVPVEAGGGPGTRDSHWRESVFRTELMTGWSEPPGVRMPLSRISVGSMADLGYVVNLAAADPYRPPSPLLGPRGNFGSSNAGGTLLRTTGAASLLAKQLTGIREINRVIPLRVDELASNVVPLLADTDRPQRPLIYRRD
ncbi:MAG: DVUA0089 family protein [Gemmatales bacterium]|nr:DVUA0089 family protein [Gemmatales bacterium]MDW7993785.1 DVUA0089 family protein [Gemmatales bacterium]